MEVSRILALTRPRSRSEGTRKFASFQKSTVVRGSYLLFSRDPIMVDFFAGKRSVGGCLEGYGEGNSSSRV